jgi:FkbM family methyltransferase
MNEVSSDPISNRINQPASQPRQWSMRRFFRRVAQLPAFLSGRMASAEARLDYHESELRRLRETLEDHRNLARTELANQNEGLQSGITGGAKRLDDHDRKLQEHQMEIRQDRLEAAKGLAEANRHVADLALRTIEGFEAIRDLEGALNKTSEHSVAQLSEKIATLDRSIKIQSPWKPEDKELAADPEFGLMGMLYSFVPSRIALDVGANTGRVSEVLLEAGYLVYAFEPFPEVYDKLTKALSHHQNFQAFPFALGSEEGTMPLHLMEGSIRGSGDPSLYHSLHQHAFPEGMRWTSSIDVEVKTIRSLVDKGTIPPDIGLLKVDTEGYDLEVILGLDDLLPPIVVTEFWGDNFVFSKGRQPNALDDPVRLIKEMRGRGYWWTLIVYRLNEPEQYDIARFTANSRNVPTNSWGNIFFFRYHEPFIQSLRWCSSVLPALGD